MATANKYTTYHATDNMNKNKLEALVKIMDRLPQDVMIDLGNGIWISRQEIIMENKGQETKIKVYEIKDLKGKEREILENKLTVSLIKKLDEHVHLLMGGGQGKAELLIKTKGIAEPKPVYPFINAERLPMFSNNVQEYTQMVVESLNKKNGKKVQVEVVGGNGIVYSFEDEKIIVGKDTPKEMLIAGLFQAYTMALIEGYVPVYGRNSSVIRETVDQITRELVQKVHGSNGLQIYEKAIKDHTVKTTDTVKTTEKDDTKAIRELIEKLRRERIDKHREKHRNMSDFHSEFTNQADDKEKKIAARPLKFKI